MPVPDYPLKTRLFMRNYITSIGGITSFQIRHKIARRTAERIYSGNYAPSESLVAECRANWVRARNAALIIDDADVPY